MSTNQKKQVSKSIIIKQENAEVKRDLKSNLRKRDITYEGMIIRLTRKIRNNI